MSDPGDITPDTQLPRPGQTEDIIVDDRDLSEDSDRDSEGQGSDWAELAMVTKDCEEDNEDSRKALNNEDTDDSPRDKSDDEMEFSFIDGESVAEPVCEDTDKDVGDVNEDADKMCGDHEHRTLDIYVNGPPTRQRKGGFFLCLVAIGTLVLWVHAYWPFTVIVWC